MHSIEYFTNLKEVICLRGCFSVAYKGNVIRRKFWLIDSRMVWAAGEITPPVYIYVCTHVKMFACVWKHILMCVWGLKLMFIIALRCNDLDRIVMLKLSLPVPDSGDLVSAS